jgi:hypothetical protein
MSAAVRFFQFLSFPSLLLCLQLALCRILLPSLPHVSSHLSLIATPSMQSEASSFRSALKERMSQRRPRASGDDAVTKQLRPAAKISRGLAAVLQKQGIPVLEVIRRIVGSPTAFSMDHLNDIITDMRREANAERAGISQPPHGAWDDLAIVLTGERLPQEYRQAHDSNASTFLRNLRGCSAAYNMLGIYMFQMPDLDYDVVCSLYSCPPLPALFLPSLPLLHSSPVSSVPTSPFILLQPQTLLLSTMPSSPTFQPHFFVPSLLLQSRSQTARFPVSHFAGRWR